MNIWRETRPGSSAPWCADPGRAKPHRAAPRRIASHRIALQPPAKLIYQGMSGNALFNLPAAGQVLSRPCSTLNAVRAPPESTLTEDRRGSRRSFLGHRRNSLQLVYLHSRTRLGQCARGDVVRLTNEFSRSQPLRLVSQVCLTKAVYLSFIGR